MFCIKCGVNKQLHKRCRECAKIYHQKYHQENKDKINQRSKMWYENNKEKVSSQFKLDGNKKLHKRQYNNRYEQKRKMTDPTFKLRRNCSRLINHVLNGCKNGKSILKYLPYSMEDLKRHLEDQFNGKMSWKNYGIYWHIDHIYPQSLLPYVSMEDENFKKCWSLSNLRPLEAIENMKKSNKVK